MRSEPVQFKCGLVIGLVIGRETWRAEQPPTSKWLNHQKTKMVGAIGFELMKSNGGFFMGATGLFLIGVVRF
jgi:hypothetical protein